MITMQGPGIYLAPFTSDAAPFNSLEGISAWAGGNDYKGVSIPSWDRRLFDLEQAAKSVEYCDNIKATLTKSRLQLCELSTHLQGHAMASHPAYDQLVDPYIPEEVRNQPAARQEWAAAQLLLAAKASRNLGFKHHVTASGSLLWPFVLSEAGPPPGLADLAFDELAKRWRPILDAFADAGVELCFAIRMGEDVHDGLTFERFLAATGNHPACRILYDPGRLLLLQVDYVEFLDAYHDKIGAVHISDAEFAPNGRQGVAGSYRGPRDRAARFRSPGDGQVDFGAVFTKLTTYGYSGWVVVNWACAVKHPLVGAQESAAFVAGNFIAVPDEKPTAVPDAAMNRHLLGLPPE